MTSSSFLARAVGYSRALLHWVFVQPRMAWYGVLTIPAALAIAAACHWDRRAFMVCSLLLQVVGAYIAFVGIQDNLKMFAGPDWGIETLRERHAKWRARKPSWKPQIGAISGAAGGIASAEAFGHAIVTTQGMPTDTRIDILERQINRLSADHAEMHRTVKGVEKKLADGISEAVDRVKADQKKAIQAIAGGPDLEILGIAILVWGSILASLPDLFRLS